VAPDRARRTRRCFLQGSLALVGLGLFSGCGGLPLPGRQPAKILRIGFLGLTTVVDVLEAFRDGLRELGYVEGRTVVIEARWAESNEQFPTLAAELVGLPVDLIVAAGLAPSIQAAMGATRTIPIVFAATGDPVGAGFVASLARPGGNVTGLSTLGAQTRGKGLQLLRELVPGPSRVLYLGDTVAGEATGNSREVREAALSLGVQLLTPTIRGAGDLPAAFELAVVEHAEALLVTGAPLLVAERGRIAEFATAARLPSMFQEREFVTAGGLMAYGPNRLAMYRRAAVYVDKILQGAKPADLPVEQPTEFDFVINLKTATALGLAIPQSVLQQATEVIQ
jgi:putative ABC transport system substrate-binding protein